MKKIIYSLVAMLFMGSIFTSCLEQTELPGLYQVRLSQAGYLDALAELKKADATYRQAEATVQLSIAEMNKAVAAKRQAEAESLKALADIEKAKAEYTEAEYQAKIDSLLDKMAEDELAHQKKMAEKQVELAQAQKALADALAKIDLESLALTTDQLTVINGYKAKYEAAAETLNNLLDTMLYAENSDNLYDALYDAIEGQATAEYAQELIEEELAYAERQLAYSEQEAAYWKALLNDFETDYLAEAAAFQAIADEAAAAKAELIRDLVIYENVYGPILHKDTTDAINAYEEAVKEPLATLNTAVAGILDQNKLAVDKGTITPFEKGKKITTATPDANGKLSVKAKPVNYGKTVKQVLPANGASVTLLGLYEAYLNDTWKSYSTKVAFRSGSEETKPDTLVVTIPETDRATYLKNVDTVWSVGQSSFATKDNRTGLWTAYEDFGRDYLYSASAESMKDDAELIQAFITKKKAEYDSILGILEDAPADYADTLMAAWYREVMGLEGAIEDAEEVLYDLYHDDVYTVTEMDVTTTHTWWDYYSHEETPIVFSVRKPVRSIWRDDNDRTVIQLYTTGNEYFNTGDYYWTDDTHKNIGQYYDMELAFAPSAQDTATVFNAIVDYFKAIAAVDVKAVPYLEFVQFNSNGYAYIDSVRADLMNIDGLKLRPSNSNLVGENIKYVATYDNKGIVPGLGGVLPASNVYQYKDALKNVINLYVNYAYEGSDIDDYFQYVKDYNTYNFTKKTFANYTTQPFAGTDTTWTATEFAKQSKKTETGKALAAWMNANKTYFGVEGFAGFGEKVFFDYETFTDPSNVVIFTGLMDATADSYVKTQTAITKLTNNVKINHWNSQYGFVTESIFNNMAGHGAYAGDYANFELESDATLNDMEANSLVFQILQAEFLYKLATGASSDVDAWNALETALKAVKAALDAEVTAKDAEVAARAEAVTAFNAALDAYKAAVGEAAKVRDDAIKAAKKAYNDGREEITDQLDLLDEIIEFNEDMAEDLMTAYDLYSWRDLGNDEYTTVGIEEYLWEQYEDAIEACEFWATAVDTIKFQLGELENEDADMYMLVIAAIKAVQGEISEAEIADAMFWYEYWKAAYEAALALIMPEE